MGVDASSDGSSAERSGLGRGRYVRPIVDVGQRRDLDRTPGGSGEGLQIGPQSVGATGMDPLRGGALVALLVRSGRRVREP